jgi:hypothetical protein
MDREEVAEQQQQTVTPAPHRSHDISSLLNPTTPRGAKVDKIDPALSNLGTARQAAPAPAPTRASQTQTQTQDEKLAKKEKLRREAEAMREELARKERELLELDE